MILCKLKDINLNAFILNIRLQDLKILLTIGLVCFVLAFWKFVFMETSID